MTYLLSKSLIESVLTAALAGGGDLSELFFEDTRRNSLEYRDGKVQTVRLSRRLKTHPVCLASAGELSLEMEKVLNAMPADNKVKARRVLEINENHPIFATLSGLLDTDPDKLRDYSELLYDQALLIEGMAIEDPVAFSTRLCALMSGQ